MTTMAISMVAAAMVAAALFATAAFRRKNKPLAIPSMNGKHLFITGASSGIGLAIAKQALLEGAYVTLSARNALKLNKAAENLVQDGHGSMDRIKALVADVGDYTAISTAVKDAFSWKPIDVLVCNAGLTKAGYIDDMPIQVLEQQVQTNLMGVIYTVHSALPLMKSHRSQDKLSIVIVSSAAALFLLYGSAVYTATKHALKGFAECLRLELLPHNINVNLICPGFVQTALLDDVEGKGEFDELLKKLNLYDRKKADTPERIAECTLNAVKRGSFLVTVSRMYFPLVALSRGFFAPSTLQRTLREALWLPLIRIITFKSTKDMRNEILRHYSKKAQNKSE